MKLPEPDPAKHRGPYRPIDLNPVRKAQVEPVVVRPAYEVEAEQRRIDRIWEITKHTAQGCNQPTVKSEPEVPVPVEVTIRVHIELPIKFNMVSDVDTSGWDAA